MRIKLTMLRAGAEPADLVVTIDATATVADLAGALSRRDPVPGPFAGEQSGDLTLRVAAPDVAARSGADATAADGQSGRLLDPRLPAVETVRPGTVVALARAGDRHDDSRRPATVATLTVTDGPDAGMRLELPEGVWTIGRGPDNDIRLSDPTVSARHARLSITDGAEIVDQRSANGLLIGGGLVQRATLDANDIAHLGDTAIRVEPIAAGQHNAGSRSARSGGAHMAFNRSPRLAPVYEGRSIEAPTPPEPPSPVKFPLVMLAVPLLMVPVMLWAGRDPRMLVFLAMMPMMVVGHFVERKVSGRREFLAAVAQFGETVSSVRTELHAEREREREMRNAESPSVARLIEAAHALEPLLWTRRPEHDAFLELRLGLGEVTSRTTLELPTRNNAMPELWDQIAGLREESMTVDDVPATVHLRRTGALGVAGSGRAADDVARAVIVQLAILHSPAEVVLTVLASVTSAPRWRWTTWLPHVASAHSPLEGAHTAVDPAGAIHLVARLEGLIEQRRRGTGRQGDADELPVIVVLVEDDAPVERGRLVRLAEEGPASGVHVVWVADVVERLPAVCRAFVSVTGGEGEATAGYVTTGAAIAPLRCDRASAEQVSALGTWLAGVLDAGAVVEDDSELPTTVSMLGLLGPEMAEDPAVVVQRWRENGSLMVRDGRALRRGRQRPRGREADLRAVVGQGPASPVVLDLRSQGPHALVGGTTGAGKSEFLQSWVLGMATEHSPDRVTFLLVDYKGGAAFADCVDLPHTVGLVTDLSPHLVRRALTSLRAELHHREHLLGRKRAKDLVSLERTGDPECPPSLVIVVDEFAALSTEVPEFVDGVVDVAQRGRSLGLHLVLATQRPAGVIRDNLRANTNLRVALRMNDESDSLDVLGLPMAASFDPAIPGRGAARTGPGRVTLFQTGYAGDRTTAAIPEPQIDVETLGMGAGSRWEPPELPERFEWFERFEDEAGAAPDGPTDIARIVRTVASAAALAGVPEPRKPWLPTVPAVVDLGSLDQRSDAEIAFGMVDDPASQRQVPACFRPDADGNLVAYGASGSGKSTALRTLAVAAGASRSHRVQVYGIDLSSGGLSALESLPHVGAIIDGQDDERIVRLLRLLTQTAEERATRYAAARASTITEYRRLAGRPEEPRILLLLDGYGAFRADWETAPARMAWYQRFVQLVSDGRAVGIHVAVAADRAAAVPSAVAGHLQHRLVLRQPEDSAYQMLGVPADVLDASSPPGRAMTADGLELQVAVPGGSVHLADQVRAIDELAASVRQGSAAHAPAIERLAEHIPAATMPETVDGRPVLGVCDETLQPVGFDPVGTFLLAGPPQSGRTSVLRWLATAIRRARPRARLCYLGSRRSPLRDLALWEQAAGGPQDVAALATRLQSEAAEPPEDGQTGLVLVIEALADFLGTPAEAPLTDLIKIVKRNDHLVVAEGETSAWNSSWPLIGEIRNGRRGLALQPDQMEGDVLFRTPFPRVSRAEFPPGRGMVADRARVRRVQVPFLA